jgi:hypothetical protein
MKSVRQFCAVGLLTCVLSLPVVAGQIGTGVVDPPPPPSSTTEGQIGTGVGVTGQITESNEAVDPVTQMALNLVQSVLSLF